VNDTADIGRHVLIVTATGSFTVAGRRMSEPVDAADKLGKLIQWSRGKGGLQSIPVSNPDSEPAPARVWVVGGAVRLLARPSDDQTGDPADYLGRALAPLVDGGWELRGGPGASVVLAHGRGAQRVVVEVLAEQQPWLAGGDEAIADDAGELGRRLSRWYGALGVLPGPTGAVSGAVLADTMMAARTGRGRGAVVSGPGLVPSWVIPEVRIQPAWCATADQVEREFQHCDELTCLTQDSPALASAGMLTFGYGTSEPLDASAAAVAASAPKRPFGMWLVDLPAADDLELPQGLPLPHPHMAADHRVQAWITTEDLDGLAKPIRDGGAGMTVEQLGVSEAIVWPQRARVLEAWAKRLREAREAFAGDAAMLALADAAAADYLAALADPDMWADEAMRHHFQPAWAAAIGAHIRLRGRRAAMRISREYRLWPVYARETVMIYAPGRDEVTGEPIDLSDTHSRLGRMTVTRRTAVTDELIVRVLTAENTAELAAVLTAALQVSANPELVDAEPEMKSRNTTSADSPTAEARAGDTNRKTRTETSAAAEAEIEAPAAIDDEPAPRARAGTQSRRGPSKAAPSGAPAALLHTDGLWLADGTRVELATPIVHVGQVAELAYAHNLGYPLSAKYSEPGQIWITEDACREFGIDTDAISRRDRAKSLRQLTENIDFVTLAVTSGWSLGGAGEDPSAHRLGAWTRVYRGDGDKRGVMIALIPGMGTGVDEMPILAGEPTPTQIARRLQLLADALRFPWKINAGVTAVDLMLQTRTKTWSPQEWRDVVFAPSTTAPPFGIGDVESDFEWSRVPTSEECQRRYVHAYDRGGSYVAGIAGLELPIGDPVHHPDGAPFDAKTPGYWLADIPESSDWQLPYVLNPRGLQFTGPKWVCTPTLERAVELGYQPQILEARLWPRHGRVLLGWYERFRDASAMLDIDDPDAQAARDQAKIIRTHGIGIIGSDEHLKGKPGYSPERRLHVLAKAKANIVYRLHKIGEKTGQWPLAVATDTVVYASDDPDPVTAWPGGPESFGRGFGQYKPEASGLLDDHLEYLNGRDYRGKRDLISAAEWRANLAKTIDADGNR